MHFEPCFLIMDLFKLAIATGASYLLVNRYFAKTANN
ncbi:hypothetical protein QE417_004676 [Mucilaginibacter terrae]|uniref:Uncharacterized protein n=1 Tax=Mucilaginibacter terrae TaxID=1955052 RepID=A0ABU3H0R0_9SPHI|nr:hypothetical protein [Mucilaginibacter terrae]